jgi:hypothetical protein
MARVLRRINFQRRREKTTEIECSVPAFSGGHESIEIQKNMTIAVQQNIVHEREKLKQAMLSKNFLSGLTSMQAEGLTSERLRVDIVHNSKNLQCACEQTKKQHYVGIIALGTILTQIAVWAELVDNPKHDHISWVDNLANILDSYTTNFIQRNASLNLTTRHLAFLAGTPFLPQESLIRKTATYLVREGTLWLDDCLAASSRYVANACPLREKHHHLQTKIKALEVAIGLPTIQEGEIAVVA